jgi:hypothetical protein
MQPGASSNNQTPDLSREQTFVKQLLRAGVHGLYHRAASKGHDRQAAGHVVPRDALRHHRIRAQHRKPREHPMIAQSPVTLLGASRSR